MNTERFIESQQNGHLCEMISFCWRSAKPRTSVSTLLPIYGWVLNALWRELFEMMSLASRFSEQSASSSSSYDTVRTHGFGRDYRRQTLAEFRPSCNFFTSLCQSCWVKTGSREKTSQTGREGRKGGADMLWYQMKGLLRPGNSRGVTHVRTAGRSVKFYFYCRCLGTKRLKHCNFTTCTYCRT